MMTLPVPPNGDVPMLPPDTFADDIVLINEANGVLALAAVLEFARTGAKVALVHAPDSAPPSLQPFQNLSTQVRVFASTASDATSAAWLFDTIEAQWGPVSILLNAQTGTDLAPAEQLSSERWGAAMRVLDSVFMCSTEFARRRTRARLGGAILNVVDATAWSSGPGIAHSAAASAGVWNLTRTLAVEWAPDDIRVNAIVPGPFANDRSAAHTLAERKHVDLARTLPALRLGEPREFGWAATFLCSDYSAYTSGATFVIDGGNHLKRSNSGPPYSPVRSWA